MVIRFFTLAHNHPFLIRAMYSTTPPLCLVRQAGRAFLRIETSDEHKDDPKGKTNFYERSLRADDK